MTTVGLTPRSALRYQPLLSDTQHDPFVGPARASRPPQTARQRITKKLRNTTRKLRATPYTCTAKRASPTASRAKTPPAETAISLQSASLPMVVTTIALAMMATFVLIVLGQIALSWVHVTLDDLQYGRPRTFQTDAYVGQKQGSHQASHFVAMNNKGQIEVIEMPSNDPARTRVFLGPQLVGPQANLVPVTLQFVDPHHTNHPNMVVKFENTTLVFQNTGGTFQVV